MRQQGAKNTGQTGKQPANNANDRGSNAPKVHRIAHNAQQPREDTMTPTATSNATQATTASSKTLALLDSEGQLFTAALNRLTATVMLEQGDFMASIPLSDPFLTLLLANKAIERKIWA
jgi:hypothetical protein